jgi:hypothetical protein
VLLLYEQVSTPPGFARRLASISARAQDSL